MAATVNTDLQQERKNASFKPLELTYVLDGCQEFTERRRELGKLLNQLTMDMKSSYETCSTIRSRCHEPLIVLLKLYSKKSKFKT